jgi:TfoX/Sxy family transcriptional regulator of competence genes
MEFFLAQITKVSKVFINNMFLGIEIYYINILFGLFDTFGANNLHMF